MKIIYTGIRRDAYDESRRGWSFEYNNFYLTLREFPGAEVIEYPFDDILRLGRRAWNEGLLALARRERPDLLFAFLYTDELDPRVLAELKQITTTLAWFADDHWRLWNYSRYWAPRFTWAVTTWSEAPAAYRRYGITNVIRSQWACNPRVWRPVSVPQEDVEVSFVGQYNSARGKIVRALRAAQVPLTVRGWGWPEGRLSEAELIQTIARSKINLNLNTPPGRARLRLLARLFFRRSAQGIVPDFWRAGANLSSWRHMAIPQIKARPFELAGCRAFVISGYADDLSRYYEEGKEMVFYRTVPELIEKIAYYLPRGEERRRIAEAGYRRTLRDHTYEARFREVFARIGVRA